MLRGRVNCGSIFFFLETKLSHKIGHAPPFYFGGSGCAPSSWEASGCLVGPVFLFIIESMYGPIVNQGKFPESLITQDFLPQLGAGSIRTPKVGKKL